MKARKRFGQHFLEPAWVDKLIAAIAPKAEQQFLEIGPGRGALTRRLAPHVANLVAVEIDRDLAAELARQALPNVRIVEGDFLRMPLSMLRHPTAASARSLRVVGNLPYNVSSPILFRLLQHEREAQPYRDATLMLQREVADRLVASPGTKEYGVLSILVRLYADVSRVLSLPPGAFRPPPAVHSAVVRLDFRPPTVPEALIPTLTAMVRAIFTRRRKTLLNALKPFAPPGTPPGVALDRAGIDSGRRPETLDQAELARLAEVFVSGSH